MSNYREPRPSSRPAAKSNAAFAAGERVRIVNAPASYGYNGRAGLIEAIDGSQISVLVDNHPADFRCSVFYVEELEREVGS